ncbi:hypothetical protein P7K49_012850 [Saguinus oedipus]|uniref:Secreted protein n=1 Tax=Saguinus oedipus TaxID=9490 RepID=A0ABQ9VF45_SAGOE|nr:hypothetical protein P7K49_012850 [Saguinus oedipus]
MTGSYMWQYAHTVVLATCAFRCLQSDTRPVAVGGPPPADKEDDRFFGQLMPHGVLDSAWPGMYGAPRAGR